MTRNLNNTNLHLNAYTKLMRGAESVTGRTGRLMTAAGLTISQFGVLEALYHKGPLCQKDIAAKILKSTGNITLVIDNLEKNALVRRERGNLDRRVMTIHLTRDGEELIKVVFEKVKQAIVADMSVLTADELATLGSLCKKLGLKQ